MDKTTKKEKYGFYCLLALSFLLILVCNLLTPYLSDDYSYGAAAGEARGLGDLIMQEYEQYMTWNSRSVVHFLLRISFLLPNILFKLLNSLAFILLSVLIYFNAGPKKRYDARLLTGITLMLWFGCVSFSETVLWRTGAFNYLWGTVIILGFVTCYRHLITRTLKGYTIGAVKTTALSVGLFLFGIAAGWCNENTSGGGLLLTLGFFVYYMLKSAPDRRVYPWMITGPAGQLLGLIIMVVSPGARHRASLQEPEAFSGIIGIFARFQKITLVIQEFLFVWIALFLLLLVMVIYREKAAGSVTRKDIFIKLTAPLGFFAVSVITSYALILTIPTRERAHFGAAVFLFIGIAQLYSMLDEDSFLTTVLKRASVLIGAVWFFFFYMDNVTDLGRIYREEVERASVIEESAADGADSVIVPLLRPGFDTVLSDAYYVDLGDDPGYWTNVSMERYYGIDEIIAIPRDDWENEYDVD